MCDDSVHHVAGGAGWGVHRPVMTLLRGFEGEAYSQTSSKSHPESHALFTRTATGGTVGMLMSPDIFALPVTRMPCTWQAGCCVYRPYDHPRRHQPPRLNRRRHLPPRSSRIRHTHLPLPSRCGRRRRSHMAQRAQRFSSCCKPILMRRCLPSSSSQRTARQTASRCTNGRWQRSARRDFFRSCSKSLRKRAG